LRTKACNAVAYGGFIRPGPINESLLIQRENLLPLASTTASAFGGSFTRCTTYVRTARRRACHGNENKVHRNG